METVKVMVEMPALQEGWEYTGEFRLPLKGESYFYPYGGTIQRAGHDFTEQRQYIVRKAKWKPADGEKFYYVTAMMDVSRATHFSVNSSYMVYGGNCFKTREEAEVAASKFKKILAGE